MYRLTPTLHTHTTLTPRVHRQTYNHTQITRSRLCEITGTIHGSVDNGRVVFPLWHHASESTKFIGGEALVRDASAITTNRTRAGSPHTSGANHPSHARFSTVRFLRKLTLTVKNMSPELIKNHCKLPNCLLVARPKPNVFERVILLCVNICFYFMAFFI